MGRGIHKALAQLQQEVDSLDQEIDDLQAEIRRILAEQTARLVECIQKKGLAELSECVAEYQAKVDDEMALLFGPKIPIGRGIHKNP
jgi:predicted  nucleic acid-binding Zn-ribbon protein